MTIQQALMKAIERHKNGETQEARKLYAQILQVDPNHPDANHNLGVIIIGSGKVKEALPYLEKAATLYPNVEQFRSTLSYAKKRCGEYNEEEESLISRRDKRQNPPQKEINGILSLYNQNRLDEALWLIRQALALYPHYAFGYNLQGAILKALQRNKEAVSSYEKAISLKRDYPQALSNLGVALIELNRYEEAIASYKKAILIDPNYPQAYSNLGNILRDTGKTEDAIEMYKKAISLKPDFALAHTNLGALMHDLGRLEEAIESSKTAISLDPYLSEAYSNLGTALSGVGKLDDAIDMYRKAISLSPNQEDTFGNLLFVLNYHPDKTAEEIYDVYKEYDKTFAAPLACLQKPHTNDKNLNRKLRIGYVSPDFRIHSVTRFLEPLLSKHDKTKFEIFLYAETIKEDVATKRYKTYADAWINTVGMNDIELAEKIRCDRVDILVELAGHSANNRLLVFAQKPSPVSLSWLGYGYTTGVKAIDYYLTDEICAPKESEHLFAEKPWRIKNPFVYRPADDMGECGETPALKNGYITFGTITRSIRINHKTIRAWSIVLKKLPNSKLKIDSKNYTDKQMQKELIEAFKNHNIDKDRLDIGYSSPPWNTLRAIDIGLDCFPHNSGTTLFETLYMGVPYITLADRPSVGRLGSSILNGIGRNEWIADSEEEYIDKLVWLGSDIKRLSYIRQTLRKEMLESPLMNETEFAKKIETVYEQMFQKWVG